MNYDIIDLSLAFEQLERYQRSIESFLVIEKQKLEESFNEDEVKELAKTAGELEDEYYNHLHNNYIDSHIELTQFFPHQFRASFLIQTFSFLEYEIEKICDFFWSQGKVQYRMSDIESTSNLDKAKIFLKIAFGITMDRFDPDWSFIDKVRGFRNILVHHQGIVRKLTDPKRFKKVDFFFKNGFIEYLEPEKQTVYYRRNGKLTGELEDRNEFTVLITNDKLNVKLLEVTKIFLSKLAQMLEDKTRS